jgi:signal transduction histidine kinase
VVVEDALGKREAELLRAMEALRESHEALLASQQQLVQTATVESMGRLAVGIAHEVKNPLTAILMGVEYLRKHLPSGVHEAAEVLDDMEVAVKRANRVIQKMLDFSSPSLIHCEESHLNPIVESALSLLDGEFAKRQIILVKNLAESLPRLALDVSRLEQVFLHVFQNALEAMEHGGTLTVTSGVKRLGAAARGDNDFGLDRSRDTVIAVEVEDTGAGIPEEYLTQVFDPFFTTKSRGQGTGLGLTVIKKIVELHGGQIQIHNREECGARVSLLFPVEKSGRWYRTQSAE